MMGHRWVLVCLLPCSTALSLHRSTYQRRENHPTTYDASPALKGPLKIQGEQNLHVRIGRFHSAVANHEPLSPKPPTNVLVKALIDYLSVEDAPIDAKEVLESVEFYLRTRQRLMQQPVSFLYDMGAGHGLTGLLFAAGFPQLRVQLIDQRVPPSFHELHRLVTIKCPWINVAYQAIPLDQWKPHASVNNTTVVIATHACGRLTDEVIDRAILLQATALAVMPCCYTGTASPAPYGIRRALGVAWAADIDRTYRLARAGYHTDFSAISDAITPMNRILVAERRVDKG